MVVPIKAVAVRVMPQLREMSVDEGSPSAVIAGSVHVKERRIQKHDQECGTRLKGDKSSKVHNLTIQKPRLGRQSSA